ncbi:MAG: DUF3325 family protein [Burkholderiaceae bacterium]
MLEGADAVWQLLGAVIASVAGMGWLTLSMDVHWQQARDQAPLRETVLRLRGLGVLDLAVSLALFRLTNLASMSNDVGYGTGRQGASRYTDVGVAASLVARTGLDCLMGRPASGTRTENRY